MKKLLTNSLLNSVPLSTSNLWVGEIIRPLLYILLNALKTVPASLFLRGSPSTRRHASSTNTRKYSKPLSSGILQVSACWVAFAFHIYTLGHSNLFSFLGRRYKFACSSFFSKAEGTSEIGRASCRERV